MTRKMAGEERSFLSGSMYDPERKLEKNIGKGTDELAKKLEKLGKLIKEKILKKK